MRLIVEFLVSVLSFLFIELIFVEQSKCCKGLKRYIEVKRKILFTYVRCLL